MKTLQSSFQTEGRGVSCLIAVYNNTDDSAKEIVLAYAAGVGGARAGVLETTFKDELAEITNSNFAVSVFLHDLSVKTIRKFSHRTLRNTENTFVQQTLFPVNNSLRLWRKNKNRCWNT